MDWQIPLIVTAVAFAAYLVFRMRPAVTPRGRATAAALEEAKKRLAEATDDAARARALADAADACASLGRTNSTVGYYLRALKLDGRSATLVERAAAALARRPGALEHLMWRHLAHDPWTGDRRDAARAGLRVLAGLYRRRRRFHPRAESLDHAIAALGEQD